MSEEVKSEKKEMQHNSSISIERDPYGNYEAKWRKYGREIIGKGPSDAEAIFKLSSNIQKEIDVENAKVKEDFTKDEAMQKNAIEQAILVKDLMDDSWFRVSELHKKLKGMTEQAVVDSLSTLQAFGLIQIKKNPNEKADRFGVKFKVTLTNESRIDLLKKQSALHKEEIASIDKEIEELEKGPQAVIDDEQK